jgi:hypothetical protein
MIGTPHREAVDRLLIIDEHHLSRVLTEYLLHYSRAHGHRFLSISGPDRILSQDTRGGGLSSSAQWATTGGTC